MSCKKLTLEGGLQLTPGSESGSVMIERNGFRVEIRSGDLPEVSGALRCFFDYELFAFDKYGYEHVDGTGYYSVFNKITRDEIARFPLDKLRRLTEFVNSLNEEDEEDEE